MVLNNLRKSVEHYRQQLDSISNPNVEQFELLKGLSFYSDWEQEQLRNQGLSCFSHNKCVDFNHAIGLPEKYGQPMPLFDYEQILFNTLQTNKHVWIKKATGLGVTEFMLRYMAWLCFQQANSLLDNSQDASFQTQA